ncbi:MAG: hypothetical protein AB7E76_02840 [Deferribacterales bacterium]
MINGVMYDWESVEIQLPNGTAYGVTEISYDDEQAIEARYGKGSKPRGYGRGNYKGSGSMTMDRDEYERLRKSLGGSVYKADPFPVVSSYGNDDQPTVTDTLPKCKITKQSTSSKQGESKASEMKLDFEILEPIKWDGESAY